MDFRFLNCGCGRDVHFDTTQDSMVAIYRRRKRSDSSESDIKLRRYKDDAVIDLNRDLVL
jgi:hypothetical protein